MFLRFLNNEQKKLVMELAYSAANANSIVSESEKELLNGFKEEMGIDYNPIGNKSCDELCLELVKISSRKELIEICYEIMGIMYVDNAYDNDEKEFMLKISNLFKLSHDCLNKIEDSIKDLYKVYKDINRITIDYA